MTTDSLDLDAIEADLDEPGGLERHILEALIAAARERDAVVEAVRELHSEGDVCGMPVCRACYSRTEDGDMESADWPCETIRALEAATRDGGAE